MGKQELTREDAGHGALTASSSVDLIPGSSQSQRKAESSLPLPGRRLGAMALQSGLAVQSSRCSPQQLVRLVGHRHMEATRVRPRSTVPQMGNLVPDVPIG